MCLGALFGGGRSNNIPTPPTPAPPTPPPPPAPVQTAPTPMPETPTPAPVTEDETKKKAKIKAKRVAKRAARRGTTQLATPRRGGNKKPASGGLKGITTKQGVNTGTGGSGGGTYGG